MKTGRNDPCPCGSGKKYKKCCGLSDSFRHNDDSYLKSPFLKEPLTGTDLDEYLEVFHLIAAYGATLMSRGEYKKVLQHEHDEFERRYKPGEEGGLSDSLFMNWFLLDLRFGTYQKTVAERFLEEKIFDTLVEPGKIMARRLADSYASCYQVKTVGDGFILFEEIGTQKMWKVVSTEEPYEQDARPGLLWYARFVGTPQEAHCFGSPYVFSAEAKSDLTEIILLQRKGFEEYAKTRSLIFDILRDSCKASAIFWAEYLYRGMHPKGKFEEPRPAGGLKGPEVTTTDGEKLRFCSVYFKIKDKNGLKGKLSGVRDLEYDSQERQWIWLKKGNKKIRSSEGTILGSIKVQGDHLVAAVNSLERALRLKNKLTRGFGAFLEYERIEGRDLPSMPPLTKEKMRQLEEEQKKIYADPKARKFLKQKAEDYYFKDWISQKIPALDHQTPRQAAKTREGRLKLEVIINRIEMRQKSMPDNPAKIDVDLLRKMLGLSHGQ